MREFRSAAFGRCKIPRNHEQASGVVFLHGLARGAPDRTVRYPDGRRTLIIVTTFLVSDRAVGKPFTTELTRRRYLESASTLIVEVTRAGVLGGPAATTRSIYRKG